MCGMPPLAKVEESSSLLAAHSSPVFSFFISSIQAPLSCARLDVGIDLSHGMTDQANEDNIMAHPNEALLRETYEAVGQGDLQVLLDALADDVRWADSSLGPLAGEYRGKEAVGVFFAMMFEVYAGTLHLDVLDVVANEDHAVVLTREHGKIGGEPVSWRGTHIWTFRDGECAEFVAINDRAYNRFWVRRNASPPIASVCSA